MAMVDAIIGIAMELIMIFEGFSPTPYDCPGGFRTIGYGHVLRDYEHKIREVTEEEAREMLRKDCLFVLGRVQKLVKVELTVNQMAALVSFCYNVGCGAFYKSTMRKKINTGKPAADEFLRWDKISNKKLTGLTLRRRAEHELFLNKGIYAQQIS